MGCTVGLRAILDLRLAFTTLDENWIEHALYLSARSRDAKYRVRESKSNSSSFTGCLSNFLSQLVLALVLNTCVNGFWNHCYVYRRDYRDFTPFKCWSGFRFFLGLLASFAHARLILCNWGIRKLKTKSVDNKGNKLIFLSLPEGFRCLKVFDYQYNLHQRWNSFLQLDMVGGKQSPKRLWRNYLQNDNWNFCWGRLRNFHLCFGFLSSSTYDSEKYKTCFWV